MLFIKQAVLCLISPLHLPRRFATWWILKNHILKRVGEIYKRTSMKDLLKIRIKALLLIAILLLSVVGGLSAKKIAIIDAGSSGSRLYVYDIDDATKNLTVVYPITPTDKVASKGIALSNVAVTADAVDGFLNTMAGKYSGKVGEEIDLYVLATAGMRTKSDKIYQYMSTNKIYGCLKLVCAMTISGKYEGLYAWIATNYKNNKLIWNSGSWSLTNPYGILEIGGASMQIAYRVSSVQPDNCIMHNQFGIIYAKSYLGGGADLVYEENKVQQKTNFGVLLAANLVGLNLGSIIFVGLGKPIENAFKNAGGETCTLLDRYGNNNPQSDLQDQYHSKMNARYIAYVLGKWKLDGKFVQSSVKVVESDWTEGAALDIVVNNQRPEAFNYDRTNPN